MMMRGYDSDYLETAMKNLGEAFDYVTNTCGLKMDSFMDMFIASEYAEAYEDGSPRVISGMSGTELVLNVFDKLGYVSERKEVKNNYDCSPEYWCGWILAYFEWKTGVSFRFIHSYISMQDVLNLYSVLHEASEEKTVEILSERIKEKIKTTRLQKMRIKCELTQKELSEKSGVNIRTLQQYELGAKDINKASAMTVYQLSKALNCRIEDLLELI